MSDPEDKILNSENVTGESGVAGQAVPDANLPEQNIPGGDAPQQSTPEQKAPGGELEQKTPDNNAPRTPAGGPQKDNAIERTMAAQDNTAQRGWWLGQTRGNLDLLKRCRDIRAIQDMFWDLPGIVIGAGPSLAKNAHLLIDKYMGYPLFCTDRALPMMQEIGVTPQFVVVADGSDRVAGFFKGCNLKKTILVAPTYVHASVLRLPWRLKVAYNVTDSDTTYMNAARNILMMADLDITAIPGTLIVGNTAFIVARIAGCNPITFIGNDMSMLEAKAGPGEMIYEGKDPDGNTVYSLPGFLAGLEWLMKYVKVDKDIKYGKLKVFNSTEGGIMYGDKITGLPLRDFVEQHPGYGKSLETLIHRKLGT